MKIKVSLLCPSRNRAEMLRESLASLGRGSYEVLVAVDEDDPQLEVYKQINRESEKVRLSVMPRYGYQNLHEYYNRLASKARGDWIGLWNDDTLMQTEDWIEKITAHDHTAPKVLNPWKEPDNLFPFISRAWYQALGHFSRNTHADSWVQQVAEILGCSYFVHNISIRHYGEELNDETHKEVRDIVRQTSEAYRKMDEERREDARKISDYVKEKGLVL